jgi:NAD(P)-dependent dehydrogenase (short-subunit alcohol dehydrogenase family)
MSDANRFPKPPFEVQPQARPGQTSAMTPRPDHGEQSYQGSGKLQGKVAIITGADSGIGRAVAIAFAREGADLVLSYLDEQEDAEETARWVTKAGREVTLIPGDISDANHASSIVTKAIEAHGHVDIVVNNAAYQNPVDSIDEITVEDWNRHFAVNVHSMFYIIKAAVPHLKPGASIINTASMNAKKPVDRQLAYSATKAAITNMTANLAQAFAEKGVRVNAVLPGPIWTPLIPSTMSDKEVSSFGSQVPIGRPGQPAELASAYVMLASDESSYTSGAMLAVTGGSALL